MDFFKRYFESKVLAGAVTAVATPRQILAVEAEGFADVAAGRPMVASQGHVLTFNN